MGPHLYERSAQTLSVLENKKLLRIVTSTLAMTRCSHKNGRQQVQKESLVFVQEDTI